MMIIITGASRGIGAALARSMTAAGHKVCLVSRNRLKLDQVADRCNQLAGGKLAYSLPFDLTDLPELEREFRSALMAISPCVDALVNNAGQLIKKPFDQISTQEARKLFDANFFAPAEMIRICLPLMEGSPLKHIVNITSMSGYQGSAKFSGLSYYGASKAALSALTECLAEEYKTRGVRVNGLAIGAVQTEMFGEAFPDYKAPLKPEQMADFVRWFALEGAAYFNGKVLPVSLSTP
jgi:NAD(P)-dependent dehydrogenase (short-subunit alcohol dehydrogenase family)